MEGFNTFEKQQTVLMGMSGGVDSSVAVRILQDSGFAVQGAVIRFFAGARRRCCGSQGIRRYPRHSAARHRCTGRL